MIVPSSKTSSMLLRLVTLLLVAVNSEAAHSPFGSKSLHKHNKSINRNRNKFSSSKTIYPQAQVEHRLLQTDDEICDSIIANAVEESFAPFCTCERAEDTYVLDCVASDCPDCELLSEETCAVSNDGVILAAFEGGRDLFYSCIIYVSGAFDNVVCLIENGDNACAITIDDVQCDSCSYVDCDAGYTDIQMDCSNILPGNDWNTCTDDIPETSPLVSYGINDRFFFDDCFNTYGLSSPSEAPTRRPVDVEFIEDIDQLDSPSPPPSPTAAPNMTPITSSSAAPSASPSASPRTPSLSTAPSAVPSDPTGVAPEPAPTRTPAPLALPITAPSSLPLEAPSAAPTETPSKSVAPSTTPSVSVAPSITPSNSPTMFKLNVNIRDPTTIDRFQSLIPVPTQSPSNVPSGVPSGAPSSVPTITAGENIIATTDANENAGDQTISGSLRLSPLLPLFVAAGIPCLFLFW